MKRFFTFLIFVLIDEVHITSLSVLAIRSYACPQVVNLTDFNPLRLSGRWYLSQISPKGALDPDERCRTLDISVDENDVLTFLTSTTTDGNAISRNVTSKLRSDPYQPGRLIEKSIKTDQDIEYWILGTDYESYFVLYRCYNFLNKNFVTAEIYMRRPKVSNLLIIKAFIVAERISTLRRNLFANFNQVGCRSNPIKSVHNDQLTLCPQISTLKNFYPTMNFNYSGRWYLSQISPKGLLTNHDGRCTFVDSTIDKNNLITFFISTMYQNCDSENSPITFWADPRKPGRLKDEYLGPDLDIDRWILGSDYDSYLILYRCFERFETRFANAEIYTRQPEPSDSVINEAFFVVETLSALDRNSFAKIDQAGCQPSTEIASESMENEIDLFVRYCPFVKVIAKLTLCPFMGRWYPIRQYPKGVEDYICLSFNFFSTRWNQMSMAVNGFDAKTGQEDTSSVVEFRTDSPESSKFKLIKNGRPTSDFWILGTDYHSYAVIYRCDDYSSSSRLITIMIVTRDRKPENSVIDQALKVLRRNRLESFSLSKLYQKNCTAF